MKHRYDVLVCDRQEGGAILHAARWLFGAQKYTPTGCGRDVETIGLRWAYPPHDWWISPHNPGLRWCETCRSMLIGRLDEQGQYPYSNTGVKPNAD